MTWKLIPGFSYYEANKLGQIRSVSRVEWATRADGTKRKRTLKGKILAPYKSGGYWCVSLKKDGDTRSKPKAIHILVLSTFKTNKHGLIYACHKDDDRDNNKLSNLYWGSGKDNAKDRYINNKIQRVRLTDSQIFKYLKAYHVNKISIEKIIEHSKHSRNNVRNFLSGKTHLTAFIKFKKAYPGKLRVQPKKGRGMFKPKDLARIKNMNRTMSIGLIAEKENCSWGTIKNVVSGRYDGWV